MWREKMRKGLKKYLIGFYKKEEAAVMSLSLILLAIICLCFFKPARAYEGQKKSMVPSIAQVYSSSVERKEV